MEDVPEPGEPFTVPGSPIASLAPDEMVTLSATRFLAETTANEVFVTGHAGSSGGPICNASDMAAVVFLEPPPKQDDCSDGKPRRLVFEYTGEGCDASDNDQGSRAECHGDPNGAEPVGIVVTRDEDDVEVTPGDESITVGSLVTFEATGDRLKSNLQFKIRKGSNTKQELKIHTACSQPLNVGDQFGSMILREFEAEAPQFCVTSSSRPRRRWGASALGCRCRNDAPRGRTRLPACSSTAAQTAVSGQFAPVTWSS